MGFHDVLELVTDFAGFPEGFWVDEMFDAPGVAVLVCGPLSVYMEEGKMVGFWDAEFLPGCVGFFGAFFGAVEDCWDRQH